MMSLLDEIGQALALDAFENKVVLIVLTSVQLGQLQAELEKQGKLVTVTRNALWGVPFEVNDLWVGEPGLFTAADVEKYRQVRRSLEMRLDPVRRLKL